MASNDAPLARVSAESHRLPERFGGAWQDLNSIGVREPAAMLSVSYALLYLLKPIGFAKLFAPVALLMLGCSAWLFFRKLRLSASACILGGLAASLNSDFFSTACWGVAGHVIAVAMIFLAMAALVSDSKRAWWPRVILAGMAVGMAVTEAADVGAILSLFLAAFVVCQAFLADGSRVKNLFSGVGRLALIAVIAGLVSARALTELLSTNVVGMEAGHSASQGVSSQWDWATQWSLPKTETLGLVVPGLFGFRTDTPEGGAYWGTVGRDVAWDQYDKNGRQGPAPAGFARYTGGGIYSGVLVVVLAVWTTLQLWRGKKSLFGARERRWLWFWVGTGLVSLLLAYGRYAPFYRLFYDLPHFSLIRNPVKFIHVLSIVLVVLFAYGVDSLWRMYLEMTAASGGPAGAAYNEGHIAFDRGWVRATVAVLVLSLLAWFFYGSSRERLEQYLANVDVNAAEIPGTVSFSIMQVGWFVLFFALAVGVLWAILSGMFARKWAVQGAAVLGVILVVDLVRANQPWIVVWDYEKTYASNPVVDRLRDKPYEHRVAQLPLQAPPKYALFDQLYKVVWLQSLFPWFNIQSLNIIQMSRAPDDLLAYDAAFKAAATSDFPRVLRRLQLTNTRYLVGAVAGVQFLESHTVEGANQLHLVERFSMQPMPGAPNPPNIGEMTVVPDAQGDYGLFEVSGILPRAKLYGRWVVETNGAAALKKLAEPDFDYLGTVLVCEGVAPANASTNRDAGTVEFASYSPRDIVLKCEARADAVLLLNDRYDPNWKVLVDGRPEQLLRCNYLMRGVQVGPGAHTVEFKFSPPMNSLYVSAAAIVAGLACVGLSLFTGRKAAAVPAEAVAGHRAPAIPVGKPNPNPTPKPAATRKEKRPAVKSRR